MYNKQLSVNNFYNNYRQKKQLLHKTHDAKKSLFSNNHFDINPHAKKNIYMKTVYLDKFAKKFHNFNLIFPSGIVDVTVGS